MSNTTYQILERQQKFQTKVYAFACLLLIVLLGFYGYKQWIRYDMAKSGIGSGEEFVAFLSEESVNEETNYNSLKVEFDALDKEINTKLADIFPPDNAYTELTRQIDSYEQKLAKRHNPFEVSNINFQNVVKKEEYSVLPLRMTIRSSSNNFIKFLHLIENSGTLNGNTRLMDISSIRLNFEDEDEDDGPKIISFSVQINAYFQ